MQVRHFTNNFATPQTAKSLSRKGHFNEAVCDNTKNAVIFTFADLNNFACHFTPNADTQHLPQLNIFKFREEFKLAQLLKMRLILLG